MPCRLESSVMGMATRGCLSEPGFIGLNDYPDCFGVTCLVEARGLHPIKLRSVIKKLHVYNPVNPFIL